MKKILTVGVFDMFHFGHLRLLKRCRQYGDFLIVAVQETEYILKYKPQSNILYSTAERVEMLEAISLVDQVITYRDIDVLVQQVDFDLFVKGPDQLHSGFKQAVTWCMENGREVIEIERTDGISSTFIKKIIEDLEK